MRGVFVSLACFVAFHLVTAGTTVRFVKDLFFPRHPHVTRLKDPSSFRGFEDNVILENSALVRRYGYPAEEHTLTTEDGYILTVHRIPYTPLRNNTAKWRGVVLLQHGIVASSDTWLLNDRQADLPFLLHDAGYDVWLGNFRGNTYCRAHESLSTDDKKFWDFSYHEHGYYDLPAMIDYILETTNSQQIHYIGHSMGTTSLYVLLSMRPEYNKKIRLFVNLAPVAYWKHRQTPLQALGISKFPLLAILFERLKIYDVVPQTDTNWLYVKQFCSEYSPALPICKLIIKEVVGWNPMQLNLTLLPYYFHYYPTGTSVKCLGHYYQNICTGEFQMFNHGHKENMKIYGQRKPPSYDIKKVVCPVALIFSKNDALVKKEDVDELSKHLPNVVVRYEIPYKLFTHMDYLWATDVKSLIYDYVIDIINKS